MQAVQRRADLLDVEVERAVWSRGSRPWPGRALRFGFASLFLGLALAVPDLTTRLIFVATGVLALLFIQPLMDSRLEAIGRAVGEADRRRASKLLASLDTQRLVVLFASHGWVALQRGRLNLVLGNGRAAAKSFFDASRILGVPGLPALVSAQAHALMIAGDRKEARPLLQTLEKGELLSPRDRVDLGLALLEESGRATAARAHLEAAREQLGGHPRVLAGLALAYARTEDGNEGMTLLEAAEKAEGIADDEIANELVKRARKALRPVMEAAEKRQRKARAAPAASGGERAAAAEPAGGKASKKDRKDRRKERREKRRAARAEAGADAVSEAATDSSVEEADDADDVTATETGEQTTMPVVRVDAEAAKREADAAKREADAKREAEAEEAKRRAELDAEAVKQRADAEATKRRAEEEAALHRAAAEAEAERQRRAAEAEAAKRRAEAEAELAAAKRRAEEEAAKLRAEEEAAKRRAEEEAAKLRAEEEAAKRRAAAAAPTPTFLPPPMPEAPAPKTAAAPPVVQAPAVAATTTPAAPAVDESGWDDLLGDGKS